MGDLSEKEFAEIQELVLCGKMCASKKAVQPYVQKIRFHMNGHMAYTAEKISEVACCLEEHCNRRHNSNAEMHLNNAIGKLSGCVVRDQ